MRIVYLHGFASSPASRKARLFVEKLGGHGISVETPDLAPDFANLTISGQLDIIETIIKGEPVILIGSSMGGYLAALYAERHPEVDRLVLLAPAFDFHHLWTKELGPARLEEWRKNGLIPIFHYGTGRQALLKYQLMADAQQYKPFPDFPQPCLLLHGLKDTVVPFENSARFAANHPNVKLISFDSGHELTGVLNEIWNSSSVFLLGPNTKST
jgi:pimeloyl-ACP methyl ester carboxylesterase